MIKVIKVPWQVGQGIKPNHRGLRKDMEIFGGDAETCQGKPMTWQIWGGSGVRIMEWHRKGLPLTNFLARLRIGHEGSALIVFFHNLRFDLGVLLHGEQDLLLKSKVEFHLKSINFRGTILYGKACALWGKFKDGPSVAFIDTMQYFQTSLARLAQMYCPNLPKLKKPARLGEIWYKASNKYFVDYAMRDPEITYHVGNAIIGYHDRFDVALSISAPQFASRVFRHKYIPKDARIPLPPEHIRDAALLSYHGGRNALWVEPGFYEGVSEADITSAYPYAMTQIPNFLDAVYGRTGDLRQGHLVKVRWDRQGPYPSFYTHENVLAEKGEAWITSYEALIGGERAKYEVLQRYFVQSPHTHNPLREYVQRIFMEKEKFDSKDPLYYFYKVGLLNSLYGKFIESHPIEEEDLTYGEDGRRVPVWFTAGRLYNPFIASLITGYTRAHLRRLESQYAALHSSTDSILTQKKVVETPGLGGLTVKAKGSALLLRTKLYIIFDDRGRILKSALHGFWGTPTQLIQCVKSGRFEYTVKHMNQIRESIRQGLTPFKMETRVRTLNLDPDSLARVRKQITGVL